jgi:hypothetical protein
VNKRHALATLGVTVKALVLISAGKLLAIWLSNAFPDHANWIEKAVLLALVMPLLAFFVLGPYFRGIGLGGDKQRPSDPPE